MTKIPTWSLIICTYNAGDRLIKCLENLTSLDGINDSEVIVVDNDSNDESIAHLLLHDFNAKFRLFRVVTEKQRGLSFARIRGCREALGRFLLFIDDDNLPAHDFIKIAGRIFESDAKIGLIGGRSCLPNDFYVRSYYRPFLRSFAVGEQHENTGILSGSAFLWGACLCVKREALISYISSFGGFVFLDRKVNSTLSGGDGELVISLRMMGWSAYYSKELVFVHAIASDRFSVLYLTRLYKSFGMIVRPLSVLQRAIEIKDGGTHITFKSQLRRKICDMRQVSSRDLPTALCLFIMLNMILRYYELVGAKVLKSEIAALKERMCLIGLTCPLQ